MVAYEEWSQPEVRLYNNIGKYKLDFTTLGVRPRQLSMRRYHASLSAIIVNYLVKIVATISDHKFVTFIHCSVTIMVYPGFFHPGDIGFYGLFVIHDRSRIICTNHTSCCSLYT